MKKKIKNLKMISSKKERKRKKLSLNSRFKKNHKMKKKWQHSQEQ